MASGAHKKKSWAGYLMASCCMQLPNDKVTRIRTHLIQISRQKLVCQGKLEKWNGHLMHATIIIPNGEDSSCYLWLPLPQKENQNLQEQVDPIKQWNKTGTGRLDRTPMHCQPAPNTMCWPPPSPSNIQQLLWCIEEQSRWHMVWHRKIPTPNCLAHHFPIIYTRWGGVLKVQSSIWTWKCWASFSIGWSLSILLTWHTPTLHAGVTTHQWWLGLQNYSPPRPNKWHSSFGYWCYTCLPVKHHCQQQLMWWAHLIAWLTLCQNRFKNSSWMIMTSTWFRTVGFWPQSPWKWEFAQQSVLLLLFPIGHAEYPQ